MLAIAHDSELDRGATSVAPAAERYLRADPRRSKPVEEMIRFVVGPDGEVVPDVKRKLPGRGIWITATRAAIEEAVKRNVFCPRLQAGGASCPAISPRKPSSLLERAALDALAIAGKAGSRGHRFCQGRGAIGAARRWR